MHPNLVGTSCFDGHFQHTEVTHQPRHSHQGDGTLRTGVCQRRDAYASFALPHTVRQQIALKRQIDDFFIRWPLPMHQGKVGFAGFAVTELVLQAGECAAFFGHQQHARGFAV